MISSGLPEDCCVEVSCQSERKAGQSACGDTFISRKNDNGRRVLAVLSDGLGSGIKAGVLSTLTATAALNTMEKNFSPGRTAEMIYRTLPVCSERRISYSTFTFADIRPGSSAEIIEYDNPPFLLIREGRVCPVRKEEVAFSGGGSQRTLTRSRFVPREGDRIIFFSDGVNQSGMGTGRFPLGWGEGNVRDFILNRIGNRPDISARELSASIVRESLRNDLLKARDDITASVIYIRRARQLVLFTGPPMREERDREMAELFSGFPGRRVICGGTTAAIIGRELQLPIEVDLFAGGDLPPPSRMEGADYVSEGILTLGRICDYLKRECLSDDKNPASRICDLMINSDRILFVVGTKINEAHQDPNMPVELEIRRNIVKKIRKLLESRHLKETELKYI